MYSVKYEYDTTAYNQIEYDSLGRVWKRTDQSSNEKLYYHTSRALAQEVEVDGEDINVVTDYMARSRRFMPGEAMNDQYRYYHKDHLGSVTLLTSRGVAPVSPDDYTYDAWGEHVDTAALPTVTNNVRYAGAYLEAFADAGNSLDAIYLCGERHYWPAYGRFLQRDPLTYRTQPNPKAPLSSNPYIYGDNNPVMKKDISGLSPHWIRSCQLGSVGLRLGTSGATDPSGYNCETYQVYDRDDLIDEANIRYVFAADGSHSDISPDHVKPGMNSICELKPEDAQPKDGCPNITYITPELCCTYIYQCFNHPKAPQAKCAPDGYPKTELSPKENEEFEVIKRQYENLYWHYYQEYGVYGWDFWSRWAETNRSLYRHLVVENGKMKWRARKTLFDKCEKGDQQACINYESVHDVFGGMVCYEWQKALDQMMNILEQMKIVRCWDHKQVHKFFGARTSGTGGHHYIEIWPIRMGNKNYHCGLDPFMNGPNIECT